MPSAHAAPHLAAAPHRTEPPAAAPDILIVEDEPAIRSLLTDYLRHCGYTVQEASNGREAFRLITENPPRVVLLDMFMPEADGLELLNLLRGLQPRPPVIVMSGNTTFDLTLLRRVAGLLGAGRTLTKPFPLIELLTAVQAAIGAPR